MEYMKEVISYNVNCYVNININVNYNFNFNDYVKPTTYKLQPTTYNKDFTPFSSRDKMPHDLEVRILRFRQA